MERPNTREEFTDEQRCIALAFAIRSLNPAHEQYWASGFMLTYINDQATGTVTMSVHEKSGDLLCRVTLVKNTAQLSLRARNDGKYEQYFQKAKSALRKLLLAVPLSDFDPKSFSYPGFSELKMGEE